MPDSKRRFQAEMVVFAAALDWGLGHTTRLIPILQKTIGDKDRIIIGATESQKILFIEHFPNAEYTILPGSSPIFSRGKNQNLRFILYFPLFILHLIRDRILSQKLVREKQVDCFISDNRYALRHQKAKNILITHQLSPVVPVFFKPFTGLVRLISTFFINRFDECLVPDYALEPGLSGKLGHDRKHITIPVNYLRPQSRLTSVSPYKTDRKADLLIMISGPEKQRTVFENLIENQLKETENLPSYLVIRGLPGGAIHNNPRFINHTDAPVLKYLIVNARYIICRSGYSSIMDLAIMGKTACIVPTPGQSEQEYLAQLHAKQQHFLTCRQEDFHLSAILRQLESFKPVFLSSTE